MANDATLGGKGFAQMQITIAEIDPVNDTGAQRFAYGLDSFGRDVKVPLDTQRAKGVLPKVGETWLINKELGIWTFAAIISSPGAVASVVAGTNITVDNTDPENPVVSAEGGGTSFTIHAGLSNLPVDNMTLTVIAPANFTSGEGGMVTGTIAAGACQGEGTFYLDNENVVLWATYTNLFWLELSEEGEGAKLDEITDYPIANWALTVPEYYLAAGLANNESFSPGWLTLGEAPTTEGWLPETPSDPSDYQGPYVSMVLRQEEFIGGGEEGEDGFDIVVFRNPGLLVQGESSYSIAATYPAFYGAAIPPSDDGPNDGPGLIARDDIGAQVYVDPTPNYTGFWVSDNSGDWAFVGSQLPVYQHNGTPGIALIENNESGNIALVAYDNLATIEVGPVNIYVGTTAEGGITYIHDAVDVGNGAVRASGDGQLGFFDATPVDLPVVTGSKGGNAALASLLTALADLGLITDDST